MFLAGAIFVLTLVLVIWQPKGLSIGWSASIGAALALLTGVVHIGDIPVVWQIVWNATATFIAVIIISLLLDESGFFEWAALHVSRWGGGKGRLLFTYIVLLGAAVAALFANDGAALILTPIVIAMLLALGFSPGATLAFVMAAGFIADTSSLPLIVSNLVNIVTADFFTLGFSEYASVMVPVNIASVAATLVMLHLFFHKDIPATYDLARLKTPREATRAFLARDAEPFTLPGFVTPFGYTLWQNRAERQFRLSRRSVIRRPFMRCGWRKPKTSPRRSAPAYRLWYGAPASLSMRGRCTAWRGVFSAIFCIAGRSSLPTARRPTRQK